MLATTILLMLKVTEMVFADECFMPILCDSPTTPMWVQVPASQVDLAKQCANELAHLSDRVQSLSSGFASVLQQLQDMQAECRPGLSTTPTTTTTSSTAVYSTRNGATPMSERTEEMTTHGRSNDQTTEMTSPLKKTTTKTSTTQGFSSTVQDTTLQDTTAFDSREGTVRLVGGRSPNEGRVEIFYNGTWGTVCDDNWCLPSALVVCRMLGYPFALAAPGSARFGKGFGPIWLDEVVCTGTERNLTRCGHNDWGIENCQHGEDASVVCGTDADTDFIAASTNLPDGVVRLVNGSTPKDGRIEMAWQGMWGTISHSVWNFDIADVACRSLGYRRARALVRPLYYGSGTGPVWKSSLRCSGYESDIGQCGSFCPVDIRLDHGQDAAVECE